MEQLQSAIKVRLLELYQVSPPLGSSITETSLPLTYFDLPRLLVPPTRQLLFYNIPNIKITQFLDSVLPQIKTSLSLTLQHFYPLAGNLIWSPESNQPIIKYIHGDSVTLTAVESNVDFNHLSSYHARDANDFQHLVPQLTLLYSNSSNTIQSDSAVPILAVQITLFPNSGICLGITTLHSVVDGPTAAMFLKSWASISRLGNTSLLPNDQSLIIPFYDRTSVIKDGLQKVILQRMVQFIRSKSMSEYDCKNWLLLASKLGVTVPPNQVAVAFHLTRTDISRLRKRVSSIWTNYPRAPLLYHPSRFVLACAYVWVCLAKSAPTNTTRDHQQGSTSSSGSGGGDDVIPILFFADYRTRLNPPLPVTYFGNCITSVKASAKRNDIVGEDGIIVAVDLIMKEMRGLGDMPVRHSEEGLADLLADGVNGIDNIGGSTQFGFYKLDFGWGRPKKVESKTIGSSRAIGFVDCGNGDDGGVEINLVRSKEETDAFGLSFVNGLNGSSL